MDLLIAPVLRATEPIDRILSCVLQIASRFLNLSGGYLLGVINTIVGSPLLLVTLCLTVCGFVIGILKRIISV